ncbi:MAG: hypothetical protein ACRC8S_09305 [Fimbriiglobus sp.]
MPTMTVCPFCSERLENPTERAGRVVCSRCGESFTPNFNSDTAAVSTLTRPAVSSWKMFLTPLLMGGVLMVVVFTIGLKAIFSGKRDDRETNRVRVAPTPLSGWEYFPKETNVVLGLRPEASEVPLLDLAKSFGLPSESLMTTLATWGIRPEDIADLKLAVVLADEAPLPRALLVVQFLNSGYREKLQISLKTPLEKDGTQKTTIQKIPVTLRWPEPDVLLVATDAADLKPVATPRDVFAELQKKFNRLKSAKAGYALTLSEDWSRKAGLQLLVAASGARGNELKPLLTSVKSVAIGLSAEKKLEVQLEARDSASATKLKTLFAPAEEFDGWILFNRENLRLTPQ